MFNAQNDYCRMKHGTWLYNGAKRLANPNVAMANPNANSNGYDTIPYAKSKC